MSAERWSNSRVCAGLHSAPVRRSFDKETGTMRVVVVIVSHCRGMSNAFRIRELAGNRSGGVLSGWCKNNLKEPEKFAQLSASDDEGRQQAQGKIMSAVDQQAALHGLADERPAFDGEFDTDHQAFAADFADEVEFGGELDEAVAQLRAARADIFQQLLVLDDLEELEGHGASQRAAATRGAMHPGRAERGDLLRSENGAERKSGGERLGDQSNVRPRRKFLIGEAAAGAAKPALDLIGDQESAVLRGE